MTRAEAMVKEELAPAQEPPIWVVCARFGQHSKPYLARQVRGFPAHRVRVVTWQLFNAPEFADLNIEVSGADPEPVGARRRILRWKGCVANAGSGNPLGAVGAERRWLDGLARRDQPAAMLVHCGHYALRVLPLARAHRIPLVVHFHGVDVFPLQGDPLYRRALRRWIHAFDRIVAVAECQREFLVSLGYPDDRIDVIPCGAPVAEYQPRARGQDSGPVTFLAISTLIPIKGLDRTLRAFAIVVARVREARLLIAGDGPERASLEALAAELGIAANVTFLGECNAESVRALMKDASVFVQHSLDTPFGPNEGASVSLCEAAASALPIVTTDCGGNRDVVLNGTTGFVVDQNDVEAMARRMTELASDAALRRSQGRAARERAESMFDTAQLIPRLWKSVTTCVDRASCATH